MTINNEEEEEEERKITVGPSKNFGTEMSVWAHFQIKMYVMYVALFKFFIHILHPFIYMGGFTSNETRNIKLKNRNVCVSKSIIY